MTVVSSVSDSPSTAKGRNDVHQTSCQFAMLNPAITTVPPPRGDPNRVTTADRIQLVCVVARHRPEGLLDFRAAYRVDDYGGHGLCQERPPNGVPREPRHGRVRSTQAVRSRDCSRCCICCRAVDVNGLSLSCRPSSQEPTPNTKSTRTRCAATSRYSSASVGLSAWTDVPQGTVDAAT